MSGELSKRARSAVLKALLDTVKREYDTARDAGDDEARALHKEFGALSLEVRVPGVALPVAKVTLSPSEAAVAIDERALLAWVQREHPTEVEEFVPEPTTQVRPAFRKVLLDRLKVDIQEKQVVDPTTGQVIEWARVVPAGPPKSTMTFAAGGRDAIAAAWSSGALHLPQLLALPGAGDGAGDG